MLTENERNRYCRQTNLSELGEEGQEKLKKGKVLIIGAGGLGCPSLLYLAAAGIGKIGIVDFDKVEESNLHRQVLYGMNDIGKQKATVAAKKIREQYPLITTTAIPVQLNSENAISIIKDYDVIVDGTDNFPTRYLINDACILLKKPLVFASLYKFQLQVSVFNYLEGPTYRCLFPSPPKREEMPNCSEAGVIGVLPGIGGCLQANETIKIIAQIGIPLSGKLLVFDGLTMSQQLIHFDSNEKNKNITELGDYHFQCTDLSSEIPEITPSVLNQKIQQGEPIQIIDVRESFEYKKCNIGGTLIPLNKLAENWEEISKEKEVVIHCHHGSRSKKAIQLLQKIAPFQNLYNLKGGINAWAKEVDSEMTIY
jgi:adenylyltransferase/sulfurtransferase